MRSRNLLGAVLIAGALAGASASTMAQDIDPFVIVPDNPGGGSSGGGWRGDAVATSNVNVRRGPGTSYAVVDVLKRGDAVRISRCSGGWCLVDHRGPSGWVSQNFLDERPAPGRPDSGGRLACFYEDTHLRGRSFCARPGDSDRDLGSWNNRISSVSIRGLMTVQLCTDRGFSDCMAYNRDTPTLPWWLDRNVSAFRVHH